MLHRDHATVETDGVRTAKAMGLRNLPSKTWQVNKGWVLAANIAADLTAWTRLLGSHDQPDLRDAEPGTLRYRIWSIPARLVRHARRRILKISPDWPWQDAFITCWNRLCALPRAQLTSANWPDDTKGDAARPRGSRCRPGHAGQHPTPPARTETDMKLKNRQPAQSVTRLQDT